MEIPRDFPQNTYIGIAMFLDIRQGGLFEDSCLRR
jgi:hypothetical protein